MMMVPPNWDWERTHFERREPPLWMKNLAYEGCMIMRQQQRLKDAGHFLAGSMEEQLFFKDLNGMIYSPDLAKPLLIQCPEQLARIAPFIPKHHYVSPILAELLDNDMLGNVFQVQLVDMSGKLRDDFVNDIWISQQFSQMEFFALLAGLWQKKHVGLQFEPLQYRFMYDVEEWTGPESCMSDFLRLAGKGSVRHGETLVLSIVARPAELAALLKSTCIMPYQSYRADDLFWEIVHGQDMEDGPVWSDLQPPETIRRYAESADAMATWFHYRRVDLRFLPWEIRSNADFYKLSKLGLHETLRLILNTELETTVYVENLLQRKSLIGESLQFRSAYGQEMFVVCKLLFAKPWWYEQFEGEIPLALFSAAAGTHPAMHLKDMMKCHKGLMERRGGSPCFAKYLEEFYWLVANIPATSQQLPAAVIQLARDWFRNRDDAARVSNFKPEGCLTSEDALENRCKHHLKDATRSIFASTLPNGNFQGDELRFWRLYQSFVDDPQWIRYSAAEALRDHCEARQYNFTEFSGRDF